MKKDQGFIKWVVIIVVSIIILSFLGIDLKQTIESPTAQHNFSYVTQAALWVWNTFLRDIVMYIWDHVILPLIHTLSGWKRG